MERLTATQAAARLGVRTETLYAYVSRGLIDRVRTARGSSFDVLEVERFARSRRRLSTVSSRPVRFAGSEGRPLGVIDTDIALAEDGELWFRGVEAALVAGIDESGAAIGDGRFDALVRWLFERTAEPRADALPLRAARIVGEGGRTGTVMATLPAGAPTFTRLLTAVAILAAEDPERFDLTAPAVARTAERLIAGMVSALPACGPEPEEHAPLARRLWSRLSPLPATAARVGLLDATLVLLADHDMAASTLAARAAASARAHPYAVVTAGLGALDSALHGAVSTACHTMLRAVGDGADPVSTVAAAARAAGTGVPGFGQPRYPEGDPRARILLEALRASAPQDRAVSETLGVVDAVTSVVRERTGALPTIDMALAAISIVGDMSEDAGELVFAIARSAGWCAHAADEYTQTPLRLRPIGRYVGPDPADLQPSGPDGR
ncbi:MULTISPECIES: citrate synthase [Bacteria]|uniref:citrate synthase n=1 Tax=Bacteria TaxID=2 RepID=UPI003C7B8524